MTYQVSDAQTRLSKDLLFASTFRLCFLNNVFKNVFKLIIIGCFIKMYIIMMTLFILKKLF